MKAFPTSSGIFFHFYGEYIRSKRFGIEHRKPFQCGDLTEGSISANKMIERRMAIGVKGNGKLESV